ncbi:armadillo-type protein [Syncephalis plumigaleata]|nr:armadillo-type protein [Syncephalis plumigaleata]
MDSSASPRDRLLYALGEITLQDPTRLQAAEELLREWTTETGYFSTLQDIFLNKTLDQQIRLQAIIQLKNGIGRYWRRSAKSNALQREEKAIIRNRLFENMDEEISQLAIQNAVVVAKIARCDFPLEWENLLQTLLTMVQSACNIADPSRARLIKQRSLYTLHLVVKSLCSKTLTTSRKAFQEISPELFYHVGQVYHMHVEQWMNSFKEQQPYPEMIDDIQVSLVALKCLRRLMAHGFEDFSKSEAPLSLFMGLCEHLQYFLNAYQFMGDVESMEKKLIGKHITLVGKLYLDVQYYRPIPFVLAPKSMEIMHMYWGVITTQAQQHTIGQPTESSAIEQCLIQGICLLRALIKNTLYMPQKGAKTYQETMDARAILDQQLLTPEFATTCIETVIGQFMPLSSTDIEAWENDPENWLIEEAADAYEYKLRKCAEKLFMDMMSQFREQLAPVVIAMLKKVSDRTDTQGLLLKDAVYCAIGLGAHDLYEVLDFDDWLQHRLYSELNLLTPGVSKSARPAIYRAIVALMRPEEAIIVRLTAAESLPVDFSPYLEEAVNAVAQVLSDSEEPETRMRILNCLAVIVERMEHQIAPFAIQIAHLLPPLWDANTEEHMFQASILVTVNKLIGALKADSFALHGLVVPLVEKCVDPSTPQFVYLGEEALDLWWVTVQNTPQLTPEMVKLLPLAVALLEHGSDSFVISLRIIESYLLLDAEFTLTQYGEPLLGTLTTLIDGGRIRAVRGILQLIEREQYNVVAHYFVILSRVILADRAAFLQILYDITEIFGVFLNTWFERFDNIGHPKQRKLCAMALTELFVSGDAVVLDYFIQFVIVWTEVLYEIRSENGTDDLIHETHEPIMDEDVYQTQSLSTDTEEEKRRRTLLSTDPVHTMDLKQQVQHSLSICDDVLGMPGALQRVQSELDTDLAIQLRDRLSR